MAKLTNPGNRSRQGKHAYSDAIGTGSGTVLLVFAETIPDTYWFKTYLILAAPSLSVSFSKLTSIIITQFKSMFNHLQTWRSEKSVARKIKLLREDPYVPREEIRRLENTFLAVRIRNIEQTIVNLERFKHS